MKLDYPSMFAFEHSAGGFGMPDTPTSDEGTYVGPISLHNAIGPKRPHPAPWNASLLLGDDRTTGAVDIIRGHGLRGAGSRRSPPAHQWLLRSVSTDTGELARAPGVARRIVLLSNHSKE